jgi:alpha-tubulin suppressor-like RCC1 family protein
MRPNGPFPSRLATGRFLRMSTRRVLSGLSLSALMSVAFLAAPAQASDTLPPALARSVSVGGATCAVTLAGGLRCWGSNLMGQLGNGTTFVASSIPVAVSGLDDGVDAVAVGGDLACAVTTTGGAKCWGTNAFGALGIGTEVLPFSPVPRDVLGLTHGVKAISVGWFGGCALTVRGGVKCWGRNAWGQLGDGTTADRAAPAFVTGLHRGVEEISLGPDDACALLEDGTVRCWGYNAEGELGSGTTSEENLVPVDVVGLDAPVRSISTSSSHTCAVTVPGALMCWGWNGQGQLGDGKRRSSAIPVAVSGLSHGVASVSTEPFGTCAITDTGGAKCWGETIRASQDADEPIQRTPQDVEGLERGVAEISASVNHACVLRTSGRVQCWGYGGLGGLGDGSGRDRAKPVNVSGLPGPTLARLSVYAGKPGTTLTIKGTGFTWTTGVRFGGVPAHFTVVSDDRLIASVPRGARSGHVVVTTSYGRVASGRRFTPRGRP